MLNVCGVIAFFLMYICDLNLIYLGNKILKTFFSIGAFLLITATVANIVLYFPQQIDRFFMIFFSLSFISFIGLIYALFFALKFDDAYKNVETKQVCIKTGLYAMCRHPGVIMMFLMYLFLYIAYQNHAMLFMFIVYNALNIIYVILQDIVIFPKQFVDYNEYKKTVPFLIPSIKSIRNGLKTLRRCTNEI